MNKFIFTLAGVFLASAAAGATDGNIEAKAALNLMANSELPRVNGEAMVMLNTSIDDSKVLKDLELQGAKVLKRFDAINAVLLKMPASEGTRIHAQALRMLAADPGVKVVEANTIFKTLVTPDDTRYEEQYSLSNSGQTGGTAGADIGAELAWETTTGSKDVLIGVIDTGIDLDTKI